MAVQSSVNAGNGAERPDSTLGYPPSANAWRQMCKTVEELRAENGFQLLDAD